VIIYASGASADVNNITATKTATTINGIPLNLLTLSNIAAGVYLCSVQVYSSAALSGATGVGIAYPDPNGTTSLLTAVLPAGTQYKSISAAGPATSSSATVTAIVNGSNIVIYAPGATFPDTFKIVM
jgi:hypothetical protein